MARVSRGDDRDWRGRVTAISERIPAPFYPSILGVIVLGFGAYLSTTGRPEGAGLALAYSLVLIAFGVVTYLLVRVAFLFDSFDG